jgi:Leucine-rich repeat (LRR) protein
LNYNKEEKMENKKIIIIQILIVLMFSCKPTPKYTQDVEFEYLPTFYNYEGFSEEPGKVYKAFVQKRHFLKESIEELQNLVEFDISRLRNPNWNEITQTISSLPNIKRLIIATMDVDTLPIDPVSLQKLEHLDLIGAKGYELENELDKLVKFEKLRFLRITGLKTSHLPQKITQLKNLKEFHFGYHNNDFDYNNAVEIISGLSNLMHVEFDDIPNTFNVKKIRGLNYLQSIAFFNSDLNSCGILNNLQSFRQLENLEFNKMDIETLSDSIYNLITLKSINLRDNSNLNHQKLLQQLAQLPNLEELDFSATIFATLDNKFAFPKELAELKKLRKLNLQQNRNIDFDTLLDYLAQLPEFESLNLHFHRTGHITQLPDKLRNLKSLKELNVSYSGPYPLSLVTELPESLEKLDYSDAKFDEDIPIQKVIFTAKNLKSLNLSGSTLKELPEEIGNLKNLVHLDLSYNQIRELPESITECENLRYLNLMYTYIAKDKEKRKEIEEMLPNTLIFFGEYEVWDPENH